MQGSNLVDSLFTLLYQQNNPFPFHKVYQIKFMFSSLVALAALTAAMPRNLELQPVPQADIDSLNNLLSSVINTTNADLKKKLVDGQLDPLNKVLEGAGTYIIQV